MKLVIDIPDHIYELAKENKLKYWTHGITDNIVFNALKNATPLPKGHGKLGDLDIILNKAMKHRKNYMEAENSSYCRGKLHAYEVYVEEVENAPTIIEADKGESEE